MKEVVVFQFNVFDESIEQEAVFIIWDFEGDIDEVLTNKEEGKIMVNGEFDKFEMTSELKKLDEYVDIIDVRPFEQEAELQVNKYPVKATTSKYPLSFGGAPRSNPPVPSSTVVPPNMIKKFGFGGYYFEGEQSQSPWPHRNQNQNQNGKKVEKPHQSPWPQRNQNQNGKKVEKPDQLPWLQRNQNQNGKKIEKLQWTPKNPSDLYARLYVYPDGPNGKAVEIKRAEAEFKRQHPIFDNAHNFEPDPNNPFPFAKLWLDKQANASSSKKSTTKTGETTQVSMKTISSLTTSQASSFMGTSSTRQASSSMGTSSTRQASSSMGTSSIRQASSFMGTSSTRQASSFTQRQSTASASMRDQHSTQTQKKDSRSVSKKDNKNGK